MISSIRPLLCLTLLVWPLLAISADMNKVLRVAFETAETGFDPVRETDNYSSRVIEEIFERLLTYDYLARPAKLKPLTAESLPQISEQGKTFLFKVRKGIYFQTDPAFKGKQRELTAEDYAYSIKRFMDPKNRSPWRFLFEGKIIGLDALTKEAEKGGAFNYDAKIPGLEVIDRYTLRIRLNETDYNFPYIMAMPATGAVAREVIEAYPNDTSAHPVGTGPYFLKSWARASKIVLEATPNYRGEIWDADPGNDPQAKAIAAQMKGKKRPQIGTIEIQIINEEQSRWLAFRQGQIDYIDRPGFGVLLAIKDGKITPEYAKQGITLDRSVETEIIYYFFNMRDPTLGGFSKEKIALRRAIAMAYNLEEEIRIIRKGQAIRAQSPIPPGVVGHNPNYKYGIPYDPAGANKLLDKFGYKKGADGWRMTPDGKPLVVVFSGEQTALQREYDELWKKAFDGIGIRLEIEKIKFSDFVKAARACQVMFHGAAWHSDYPDGDNFVMLAYGGNIGQVNNGCYQSPAYDKLYEQAKRLQDSPERNKLYEQMARQLEADTPWLMGVSRYRNVLVHPWVKGYRYHPVMVSLYSYLDIDNNSKPKTAVK